VRVRSLLLSLPQGTPLVSWCSAQPSYIAFQAAMRLNRAGRPTSLYIQRAGVTFPFNILWDSALSMALDQQVIPPRLNADATLILIIHGENTGGC